MASWRGWMMAMVWIAAAGCSGDLGAAPLKLAVVGDSDSHAYHDGLRYPGDDGRRGGAFHDTTWQWTEWLHRLRGADVDQGAWGRYGRGRVTSTIHDWLGWPSRTPEKEDFAYNFAVSGAGCDDLMDGQRQVPRLVRLMDESPAQWRGGVVVVRMGVNSFGQREHLERLAEDPRDPQVLPGIDRCIADIGRAVGYLHLRHPQTRMVLVGIFDNAHIGDNIQLWQSPRQLQNIRQALDRYDDALKAMAAKDARIAFFNDRAWFAALWGGRAADGTPAYREVGIGGRYAICNSQGDAPRNAVLADGHAGTAWNALWAKAMVHLLNHRFQAGIAPIGQAELVPWLQAGMRSGGDAPCTEG